MNRHAAGLQPLRAGSWRADRDGLDLRHVSRDEQEIIRRLYLAVRDPTWATLAPKSVTDLPVGPKAGFGWAATYTLPTGDVSVRVAITLDSESLVCEMEATADAPVAYNRLGWCVLLPLTLAGTAVRYRTADGEVPGRLSALIAPQPLGPAGPEAALGPFSDFAWANGDFDYHLTFSGDVFELEDQRNWTDASFKIYSTPLALPRPHTLEPDQVLRQNVTLQRTPRGPESASVHFAPAITRPTTPRTRLSALLTSASDADLSVLPSLGVEAVRIELHPLEPASLDRTASRILQAHQAGLGYELTLWCDSIAPWAAIRDIIATARPELVIILPAEAASGTASECTGAALMDIASRELGNVPLAGGTPFNLCELQRHDLAHLRILTCTFTPTVHATDELSVLETSEALPDIVHTLRARVPAAALALGPFQGRERRIGDPPELRPSITGLPEDWLAASVSALIAEGVERLCVADVGDLVCEGSPTAYGYAVKRASSEREQPVS